MKYKVFFYFIGLWNLLFFMEYFEEYFCFVECDLGNIDKNCDGFKSIKNGNFREEIFVLFIIDMLD